MRIKLLKIILLSFLSLLSACSTHKAADCIVRRAAFDIGSGSTKMKVYTVNRCNTKIISLVDHKSCDYSEKVPYKESLRNNSNLSLTVISDGLQVLRKMKKDAIKCGATQFQATATSAFRQATNAKQAVKELEKSGISISIISQKEEARLGFVGAISKKDDIDPKNLCVWDIGGSSMQIVCTHHGKTSVFLGHLASVPFKEYLLKLQSSKKNSPNPVSNNIYRQSLERTKLEAQKVFDIINKNIIKENSFIGVGGVHYHAISQSISKPNYTIADLEQAIQQRLNKDNKQLGGGKYANTALSNLILVKGMMESLGITNINAVKINLTEGLVLSNRYW